MAEVDVVPPKQKYEIGKCDECGYESAVVRVHHTTAGDLKHCIFCEHPRHERISWGLNLIYEQERMIMESIQAVGKELLKEN